MSRPAAAAARSKGWRYALNSYWAEALRRFTRISLWREPTPACRTAVNQVRAHEWQTGPEREIWTLSDLEYPMPPVFLKYMLVYAINDQVDRTEVTDTLETALSLTLSQCRPLAAVFRKEAGEIKLVKTRDAWVPFIIKQAGPSSRSLDDLAAAGFPPLQVGEQAALEDMGDTATNTVGSDRSAAEFQVTWSPGGMILTLGYHHYCVDGTGACAFLKQWADNALALSIGGKKPAWDGANLDRSRLNGTFVPPEKRLLTPSPPPPPPPPLAPSPASSGHASAAAKSPTLAHAVRLVVVRFDDDVRMTKLKTDATTDGTVGRTSSYDSIVALVWRALTRARLAVYEPAPDECTTLGQAVNLRDRFRPPLNPHLQANATMGVLTTAVPVRDAVADGKLPHLASLVRQAHSSATEQAARQRADKVAALADKTSAAWTGENAPRFGVAVSDMRRSGLYDADFGFGPPVVTRSVYQPGQPCILWRQPSTLGRHHDDGTGARDRGTVLHMEVPVEEPGLEYFIHDHELLQYADILCV